MRKLIVLITLLAVSAFSFATTPVCEMKRTQQERAQCYEYAVNGGLQRMKGNYSRIMASNNITKKEKEYIPKNHQVWVKETEQKCSDNVCYYDYISSRNDEIETFMRTNNLTPM